MWQVCELSCHKVSSDVCLFIAPSTPISKVTASKEIVLSAGTVGTPTILMNSGIGDEAELKALGITPVLNLPSVGKNVSDHPFVSNVWFVNSTDTLDNIARNATLAAELLQQWNQTKTGPFVDPFGTHIAWLRLPNNASALQGTPDPSSGPLSPHYELITAVRHHWYTIFKSTYLVHILYRRMHLTLQSSRPRGISLVSTVLSLVPWPVSSHSTFLSFVVNTHKSATRWLH